MRYTIHRVGLAIALVTSTVAFADEVVDGRGGPATQRYRMHTCPVGWFVVGVHEGNNELLCSNTFGTYQLSQEVVDGDNEAVTVRSEMHACPQGMGMTGLHTGNNWLACAPVTGGLTTEHVDGSPPTQRENMHACPPGSVLTGIHVGNNQFLCSGQAPAQSTGYIESSILAANTLPADATLLETTFDWCSTQDVVLVFSRYFDVSDNQVPVGNPGRYVAVSKGAPSVVIPLADRRFRWHCGTKMNAWVSGVADAGSQAAQGQCGKALKSDDQNVEQVFVVICEAVASIVGEIARGIGGNWEATRCAEGTTMVNLDYASNGRLTWKCYK